MTSHYYTVVSSLPHMNTNFKIQDTPISRLQLEKRLKLLPLEKYTVVFTVEYLVWTSWFMPHQPVSDLRRAFQKLMATESAFLREMLLWFFDLRSVFAALRIRNEKRSCPQTLMNIGLANGVTN